MQVFGSRYYQYYINLLAEVVINYTSDLKSSFNV